MSQKPRRPRINWTEAELAVLRQYYPSERAADIAARIGTRTVTQVLEKAWRLGLKKSPHVIAQLARESMANPAHPARAYRFDKGFTPWNKGMTGWQPEGCQPSQFKPGQMPHNTQPVGSYRISSYGMLQQKISSAKGNNSKRWRGVHELVWIAANGPVPDGMIVVFKRGMKTTALEDITLDRVECISRQQNMQRNSYHNSYPKEVGLAIQLRGALIRQINHHTRKEAHEHAPTD